MRCKLCGAIYVVQSLWCKLCGAIYVKRSMWCKLCGVVQAMQCNLVTCATPEAAPEATRKTAALACSDPYWAKHGQKNDAHAARSKAPPGKECSGRREKPSPDPPLLRSPGRGPTATDTDQGGSQIVHQRRDRGRLLQLLLRSRCSRARLRRGQAPDADAASQPCTSAAAEAGWASCCNSTAKPE